VGSAGEESRAVQQLKSTKAMGITFPLALLAAAPTIKWRLTEWQLWVIGLNRYRGRALRQAALAAG
jgi:hypothetical protein